MPVIQELHAVTAALSADTVAAAQALAALLKINRNSVHLLQLYTQFLAYVVNDTANVRRSAPTLLTLVSSSITTSAPFPSPSLLMVVQAELVIAETEQAEEVQRATFLREAQVLTPILACVDLDIMADTTVSYFLLHFLFLLAFAAFLKHLLCTLLSLVRPFYALAAA